VRTFLEHKDYTTAIDVNPHYITPKMLQFRLQKIMDEYVAGVATYYTTNEHMLKVAEEKLEMLKEDAAKMRAKDLHELLRAWENYHRILTAEAHMKHIQFREESRYPGFYYRMDKNFVDEENWKCFVNSVYDKTTKQWTCFKRAHVDLVDKSKLFKAAYELEKDGIAGVKLKPADKATHCQFMQPEGCGIYEDRPTACRYYPVALLSMRKQDEYVDRDSYAIVKEDHCKGHEVNRTLTISEYRKEQGLEDYDELARGWRQLILKKKSSGAAIGKPSLKSRQLFFMACYDIDTFRDFVSSDAFNRMFQLGADEREMVLNDDVELMLFAFRFLKQVLFGEKSIEMNQEVVKERLANWRVRQAEVEREAAEAKARLEAEMSEDTLGDEQCPPDGKCSSN
jgi:uncharacterized protein